ncbi:unnamed protein product [Gadus morhua 'NCC']
MGCEEVSSMAAVTDKAFNSWLLMPASSFYTRPGHLLRARHAGTPERRLFNRPLPVWPRTLEWELWEPTWEKPRGQGKGLPSPHLTAVEEQGADHRYRFAADQSRAVQSRADQSRADSPLLHRSRPFTSRPIRKRPALLHRHCRTLRGWQSGLV